MAAELRFFVLWAMRKRLKLEFPLQMVIYLRFEFLQLVVAELSSLAI